MGLFVSKLKKGRQNPIEVVLFLVTKSDLIENQGGRMIDRKEEKYQRVTDMIEALLNRTYRNINA